MEKKIDAKTIVAAVQGDKAAKERVLEHYMPYIEEQSGGDEDLKQELILAVLEALPKFDLNDPEKSLREVSE